MTETPDKVISICLSIAQFNWDAYIENGQVKVTNSSGVLAGYYLVLDRSMNAGRNMTLLVHYLERGGSGGAISVETDVTLSFRNLFYA